jgi:hypothetical protein
MQRSVFEGLVQDSLGPTLAAYGFAFAPQLPTDVDESTCFAYFEATPELFKRALPRLAACMDLKVDRVDLTVTWIEASGELTADIEGINVSALTSTADVPKAHYGRDLQSGLVDLAETLRRVLRTPAS